MRVTVIPSDRWIRRDEDAANLSEWPFDDANIHAIQWYGEDGEVELTGKPKPPNEIINDTSILEPYLAALDQRLLELQQLQQEQELAAAE